MTGWRVDGPDNRWSFTVEAENGAVWLEGDVPRYRHIRQTIDAARQTSGVRSVRSNLELDRTDYGRGYRYPYEAPYGDTPYAYRGYSGTDSSLVDVDDHVNAHGFKGLHAMAGEVTRIDKQTGQLSLKTQEGTLQLQFPPSALQSVQQSQPPRRPAEAEKKK
jgi:hypothetical protein